MANYRIECNNNILTFEIAFSKKSLLSSLMSVKICNRNLLINVFDKMHLRFIFIHCICILKRNKYFVKKIIASCVLNELLLNLNNYLFKNNPFLMHLTFFKYKVLHKKNFR